MLTVTVVPTSLDLTDLTTAQRELALSQADLDGVAALITQASDIVATWCGRQQDSGHEFAAQTVRQTERLTAAAECIILDRDINPAITSVVEGADTLDAADYERDGARLFRLDDDERIDWPAEKIIVTYTTGYTLLSGLPRAIERATLIVLQQLVASRTRESQVRSESVDGVVAVSYFGERESVPQEARDLLAPFRRIFI